MQPARASMGSDPMDAHRPTGRGGGAHPPSPADFRTGNGQSKKAPKLAPQSGGGIERTEGCRNEKPSDGSRMARPDADAGLGGCIRPTTPRATDGIVRCGRSETSRVGEIPRAKIDEGRPTTPQKRCQARTKAGPQPSAVMKARDGLGRTAVRSHTKVLRAAAGRPSRPRLRTSS